MRMAFSFFLVLITILMLWFFLKKSEKQKKEIGLKSCFECGFENSQKSRQSFSLRFFFILMLFVIFDVELVLLLQLPYQVKNFLSCRASLLGFLMMLFVGLFEEWRRGLLNWKN